MPNSDQSTGSHEMRVFRAGRLGGVIGLLGIAFALYLIGYRAGVIPWALTPPIREARSTDATYWFAGGMLFAGLLLAWLYFARVEISDEGIAVVEWGRRTSIRWAHVIEWRFVRGPGAKTEAIVRSRTTRIRLSVQRFDLPPLKAEIEKHLEKSREK